MPLFQDPLTAILNAIDTQNGVSLIEDQYIFGNPTPYSDPQGALNTQMLITVNDVESPYTGSTTVYYNRLNLAVLATQLVLPLKINGLTTINQVVNAMNSFFGLGMATDGSDIVDGPLTVAEDGSGTVSLVANANSLGWIGSCELPFILGNFNLATSVTSTTLNGLLYPDETVTPVMPFGEFYSYWRDFTAQETDLASMSTSTTDMTLLATDLTENTGNAWSATSATRYSVQGATIIYNGTVADCPGWNNGASTPNPAYENVMVVQLNPSFSLGYAGYLVLHYGAAADGID